MADASDLIAQLQRSIAGPADAATSALQRLEQGIKQEQAALDTLSSKFNEGANKVQEFQDRLASAKGRLDDMKSGATAFDPRVYKQASDEISRFGEGLEKAQAAQTKLSGAMGEKSAGLDQLKAAGPGLADFAKSLEPVPPKLNDASRGLTSLGQSATSSLQALVPHNAALDAAVSALQAMGPEGEAAATALQIVATAVAFAAVTLWDWVTAAVAAAQKRDALLATFGALGQGADAGERTLAATERIAAGLPFVRSQVDAWAKSLMGAGIQGAAMEKGVKAIAAATAIMGASGGAAAEGLIKRFAMAAETGAKMKLDRRLMNAMSEAGVSADALAAQLGVPAAKLSTMSVSADKLGDALQKALTAKGGPALEALGLTWDSIKAKFDEGLGSVFNGMSDIVKPLMTEIKGLFGEFNKGTPLVTLANGAMKSFLGVVVGVATSGLHVLHLAFLNIEVAALRIAIFLLPVINAFRAMARNEAVIRGVKTALVLLAVPLVLIASLVGGVIAGFLMLATIVGTVAAAIGGAVSWVVGNFVGALAKLWSMLSGLGSGATAAAGNFISGLVGGIVSGVGAVVSAVQGLAASALAAFSLGIDAHSPSRAMHAKGRYQFAAGAAGGIDAGGDDVEAAASRMGQRAVDASDANGGGKGSGGGNTYMITITLPGGTGTDIVEQVRAAVRSVLEDELQAEPT